MCPPAQKLSLKKQATSKKKSGEDIFLQTLQQKNPVESFLKKIV
jgi:hypothetical protein